MMVVGGDSGGTRLNDVRFLAQRETWCTMGEGGRSQDSALGKTKRWHNRGQDYSDRRLGRSEGFEQRRVLQLGEARVGGVQEDEACTGEEVGRRHPDLPQTLLLLRPEEKLRAVSLKDSPPHLPMPLLLPQNLPNLPLSP